MKSLRIRMSCALIGLAIKTMPKEWQTARAIRNLVSTGAIATDYGSRERPFNPK